MSDKQFYILLGIGAVVAIAAARKAAVLADAVNPLNPDNVIHNTAENIAGGEGSLDPFFDRVFAIGDLINPWNESDDFAKDILFGRDRN